MALSVDYNPKAFSDLHSEVIRLAATGKSIEEIAELTGQSQTSVAYIVRSPLGARQLEVAQHAVESGAIAPLAYIRDKAPEILSIYEQLIKDKNASYTVRMKACQDWLDRANVKPTRGDAEKGMVSKDEIENIKKRAFEAGIVKVYEKEQEDMDEEAAL